MKQGFPSTATQCAIIAAAALLLAIQAVPYFGYRWVEDESWYSMPALNLLATGEASNPALPATDSESHVDTRPPLMPLALAASFKLFGVSVPAARIGSLLAAFLSILVVFGIGNELGNRVASIVAALLLAADNFVVIAARTARPEAWVMLWGSIGLWLILRSARPGAWKIAFSAGAAVAVASLFHILGLGWVAALGMHLVHQEGRKILRSRRTYAYVAGFTLVVLPFLVWLIAVPEHLAAAKHMYGGSAGGTISDIVAKEKLRISDFLGFSNQRLHLPLPLPLRAHIAIVIVASFVVLLRRKPFLGSTLVIIAGTQLLWFVRLPNVTPRYYATLAPVFALTIGFACSLIGATRWRRTAIAACAFCVISQAAGAFIMLQQARTANYEQLTSRLRAALPAGHSCYAAMTFAFALYDYRCHSYDRTPFSYTAEVQRPEYMVLGDRVMMKGSGHGKDEFEAVRVEAFSFVGKWGQRVASIQDPFYGHLSVYRVAYSTEAVDEVSGTGPKAP